MDELVQGAKDRLRIALAVENDLKENIKFVGFENVPKEYVELKEAFKNVIIAEYKRINPGM